VTGPALLALGSLTFSAWPMGAVLLAGLIARWNRVTLTEASVPRCLVRGHDIGPWLYRLGMCGWFFFFTAPVSVMGLLISGVWAGVR
jgi:hypothetical protein